MTERASRLLDEVLRLTSSEKAEIAAALLLALDEEESAMAPAEVDRAWTEEIRRRFDAALAGEAGVPWEQVKAEAEERLRRRRV